MTTYPPLIQYLIRIIANPMFRRLVSVVMKLLEFRFMEGAKKLARTVKATLGPAGRNVILEKKFGSPTITKDGVTVAKEIELSCPLREHGCTTY